MFFPEQQVRVFLHGEPVDMRRSFDSLYAIATGVDTLLARTSDGLNVDQGSPLMKALAYIRERRDGLSDYLGDLDVPIDTSHLECALRVMPIWRKYWMFSWTELGAKHIGIVQCLPVTCRLHDIDPYDHFVDVLQRVGQHLESRVRELLPRM